jgi:hypothetical protein
MLDASQNAEIAQQQRLMDADVHMRLLLLSMLLLRLVPMLLQVAADEENALNELQLVR